jgi:hypothetical protein
MNAIVIEILFMLKSANCVLNISHYNAHLTKYKLKKSAICEGATRFEEVDQSLSPQY